MNAVEFSRPVAVAAELLAADVNTIEHLFTTKRILLRLEDGLRDVDDAHETLLLLANEVLRFCPNVTVELPPTAFALVHALDMVAVQIHGRATIALGTSELSSFDAVVNIGSEIRPTANWITINGDGWLCRCATSSGTAVRLPQGYARSNPFGALGAACLGAGQAFLALVGEQLLVDAIELSLYTLDQGAPGESAPGPELETEAIELDALLVGCGGVGNGWVYAIRRSPVAGRVEAVDHQALRPENLGAYICSTLSRQLEAKVQIVKEELEPAITVLARAERLRFFKARLDYRETYVPEQVISALDNPQARHDVQRLWAPLTIDLAAEKLASQVIIKQRDDEGMCLIGGHTNPLDGDAELVALARATGLSVERLRNFESQITEEDIAAAPPDKRNALEEARRRGRPICGRVGDLDLKEEEYSREFTPAVPFVTAFTGIVAAAQTVKAQLQPLTSLHFQFSFRSFRSRVLAIRCSENCECRAQRGAAA